MYKQIKKMTTTIQTQQKTFNKNLIRKIKGLFPTAKSIQKLHVAGIGYVYFIRDEKDRTLGKTYREQFLGFKIHIN